MKHKAYLIVICAPDTNAIKRAEIWSSPEWMQSRCLPDRTFVAYETEGDSYQDARDNMMEVISNENCRYHYLWPLLPDNGWLKARPCACGNQNLDLIETVPAMFGTPRRIAVRCSKCGAIGQDTYHNKKHAYARWNIYGDQRKTIVDEKVEAVATFQELYGGKMTEATML